MQILFPGLILLLAWFLPESPRWLYTRGRQSDAKKVLAKYHGEGREDSVWVSLQLREYEEYLNMDGGDKRWWDYGALFKTRSARYRLACNCIFAIFAQWSGNGAVDYFIAGVLESAGVTDQTKKSKVYMTFTLRRKLTLTLSEHQSRQILHAVRIRKSPLSSLVLTCADHSKAVLGATFVDKLGRRPMMIGTFGGVTPIWVAAVIAVAVNSKTGSDASSQAFVAMVFLFNAVYAFGITPLQALFPVEVLSFEMRAKGMAFSNLSLTTAMLINQFAYPIALEKIQWKLYIVFAVWCPIQAAVCWWLIPEVRKLPQSEVVKNSNIFGRPRIARLRSSMTSSTLPTPARLLSSRRRSRPTRAATSLRLRKCKETRLIVIRTRARSFLFVHYVKPRRTESLESRKECC
tara:strand:+ start:6395 stop:7606 length:1212 start_codon:yes stop_codon:yes gene_type:complete